MRLVKRLRGERAYSMVELITVMVIMSIVMTGISTVFVQGSNAELDMNNRFQAQAHARLALDTLRKDIHCARSVTNPTTLTAQASPVSSISMVSPCAVHSTLATLGVLSGTGTGTFTIRTTTGFPTASTEYQIDAEKFTATSSGNTLTITARGTSGTLAAAHALGATVYDLSGVVSWCAVTVSGDTGLYRQIASSGTTCGSASPAVRQIDRLTTTTIFWNQPAFYVGAVPGGFGLVFVRLPVNTATAKHLSATLDTYTLCDGIVLRNSVRSVLVNSTFLTTPTSGC